MNIILKILICLLILMNGLIIGYLLAEKDAKESMEFEIGYMSAIEDINWKRLSLPAKSDEIKKTMAESKERYLKYITKQEE